MVPHFLTCSMSGGTMVWPVLITDAKGLDNVKQGDTVDFYSLLKLDSKWDPTLCSQTHL